MQTAHYVLLIKVIYIWSHMHKVVKVVYAMLYYTMS